MSGGVSRFLGSVNSGVRRGWSTLWRWEAQYRGAQIGAGVIFWGRPVISVAADSSLVIGANVQAASALRSNVLGCFQPCVLRTLAPQARLVLAENSGISGAVLCAAVSIEVGSNTLIGAGAMILDTDFHVFQNGQWNNDVRHKARPVKIGRNVFIGARAIVLKGVTIGDGAVIGAGAVVVQDVPAGCLAAGNPASVRPRRSTGPS